MITQERLKELLDYDEVTGKFVWKVATSRRVKVGGEAGYLDPVGRTTIRLDGVLYQAHRLAWLYVTGSWPKEFIDHKDRDKSNDSFSNLREASKAENERNTPARVTNKSGFKGVSPFRSGKWRATVTIGGKHKHLGTFPTPEEASEAYITFVRVAHGEFSYV